MENRGQSEEDKRIHVSAQQHTHATVVTITSSDPPEKDYIVWSIFNTVYMNFCCLGLCALAYSVKSRDRKLVGNRNEASRYGSLARSFNIATTLLTIGFLVLWIVFMETRKTPH